MKRKQKVVVVGAGLAGVTVAYELASRGYSVDLLEAREGVALETSYANGGMLTPSMADPWNSPGIFWHLLASLFNSRSAVKLRLCAIPSLLSWGVQFLRNSSSERHWSATRANHALAAYSLNATHELRERLDLKFHASTVGTMKVFRDPEAMRGPLALARKLESHGLRFQQLGTDATIGVEPQLAAIRNHIAGALYFPDDAGGDAHLFCRALVQEFCKAGGRVHTGVVVEQLVVRDGVMIGVRTGQGVIECSDIVIAAGNASDGLLRPLGISLPIRPAKGYSVTIDPPSGTTNLPRIGVVDDAMHAAVVPLGSRLRVVGTAEFAANDRTLRRERVDNLLELFAELYPEIATRVDRRSARPWTGLRPMSADGVPFIGGTPIGGLYVSSGHGHLGWTLAAGSARLLVDLMRGVSPNIDPGPYRVLR